MIRRLSKIAFFLGYGSGSSSGGATRGLPGKDGVTPHIGSNGHWFIGSTDTGVDARGDIGQAITHVALQGNQLIFTHADTAKHAITLPAQGSPGLPSGITTEIQKAEQKLASQGADIDAIKQQIGSINHRIDGLTGIFSYRGTTGPSSYPSDPKNAYFLNIHNSPGLDRISMPDMNLNDGAVYFVNNENSQNQIILSPRAGESIDKAKSLTINAQQFVMLVKNGSEWVKSATGYIPSSLDDLVNRVAADPKVADGLHTKQQILDILNNWLATPSTRSVIDKIMYQLGYRKGSVTPTPLSSDQIYAGTGDDFPTRFDKALGPYPTHQTVTINHLDQNPKKVWIAVPRGLASKVSGIVANNGLPAAWNSKNATINGKDWTIFLSPTALADETINFEIRWSV